MPHATSTTLATKRPFELALALHGHGWIHLPPHRWDEAKGQWSVPLRLGRQVVAAHVRQSRASVTARLVGARRLGARDVAESRRQLAHMLRLHDDLARFWSMCEGKPRLDWVARRGGGRLLRSATLFEDLLKILFTTNCTWAATTSMTQKLVDAIGDDAPDGLRAFPTAAQCAREPAFFRDVVRAGYRADACAQLARAFADGAVCDASFADTTIDTATMRKRLLALRGFGPYAAGQALRLLGRYDDLALDSWCRAQMASILGRAQAPGDAWFSRRYAGFGDCAGLAMWCEVTADWHELHRA